MISTPDAVEGAVPLVHARCVILKVHGDYLDARIKNTKQELSAYDPRVDRLLDQILDAFGVVVCGWSGEWDPALRAAVERAPNRRYATFWAGLNDPEGVAAKLIALRAAKFIKVKSADEFFDELAEKVAAVAEASRPSPIDVELAVAMAKRYLSENRHRIHLHDLLVTEAQDTRDRLRAIEAAFTGGTFSFEKEVDRREEASERLLRLLAICGFHARREQIGLVRRCAEIVGANLFADRDDRGIHTLLLYSAGLAVYVASLAALAGGHDETVAEMLKARGGRGFARGRILPLLADSSLESHTQRPPNERRRYAPVSEFLHVRCQKWIRALYPDAEAYDLAFDRFEYVAAMLARDDEAESGGHSFYGRWMWRTGKAEWRGGVPDVRQVIDAEIERHGDAWPYLQAGLFGGSLARLRELKEVFDKDLSEVIRRMASGMA